MRELRNQLKRVDARLLGGVVMKKRAAADVRRQIHRLEATCDHSIVVRYGRDAANELAALCDKYGSDKGTLLASGHPYPWPPHTFADFYALLLGSRRDAVRNVFECGLGTNNPAVASSMGAHGKPGASLRVWRDYFPNAAVVGADIDRDILFTEHRIVTYYLDQTDPASIAALWSKVGIDSFDLMLDDGLHEFRAGVCLFENSVDKLSTDGVYIIEDVGTSDLVSYRDFFATKSMNVQFISLYRPGLSLENNNLVVVRP